jgi:hypothetical protein
MGAYTTKMAWEYKDYINSCAGAPCCQTYNEGPLSYYDAYYVDADGNGHFTPDYVSGTCDLGPNHDPFPEIAFFSARGPSRDGRRLPTIAAPGVGIVATLSADTLAQELLNPSQGYHTQSNRVAADGKHCVLQGTSMASPHGTGSVALLLEKNAFITPDSARDILSNNARRDVPMADNDWGAGKIDISLARPTVCEQDSICGDGSRCCSGVCGATPACSADSDCTGTGATCQNAGTCAAVCFTPPPPPPPCSATGTSCTSSGQCCSNSCSGKPGKKTC